MNENKPEAAGFGPSEGGKARAEKLSPEERQEIARKAAEARWNANLPMATHAGTLVIAGREIACAVLEDKKRVLTQETFLTAIGRAAKAKAGTGSSSLVDGLPPFLVADNLKAFISEELRQSTTPILFRTVTGGRAYGYEAKLLPMVCEVYLKARDGGKLLPNQKHIAKACELLLRGLAHVGIVALVDEVTGFQFDRARRALEEILESFISNELLKWAKMFPDEFYKEMFRLRKWEFRENSIRKRPALVGKLTTDVVYQRLAPLVLQKLKEITPRDDKGRLKHKYHQRLTEDVGHPKLREHLTAVIALMRASDDWQGFYRLLQRALPRQIQTPLIDMMENREAQEAQLAAST